MVRRSSIQTSVVALLGAWLFVSGAQAAETGNLLENPGAEAGSTFPWGTTDSVREGPLAVGGAVLDATEGTHWFVADEQITVDQEGAIGHLIHYLTQTVDLGGLGEVQALTLRGDFFGAGEVTAGAATELTWSANFFATFLDEDEQVIDGTSFNSDSVPVGPFQSFSDLTFEIDPVPAGTAAVQLQYSGTSFTFVGPGGTQPLEMRIVIGMDDLSLTATVAPEPAAAAGGLATSAALAALAARRRRG
jgi:hypothetical protein